MDCGPTRQFIVAKNYGKDVSLQTLREKAQTGKEGVNLLGISEAAEAIGFRTQAFNKQRNKGKRAWYLNLGQIFKFKFLNNEKVRKFR